jgi:hypothetical protein
MVGGLYLVPGELGAPRKRNIMVKVIYQEHETPGASTLSKETREKCISC